MNQTEANQLKSTMTAQATAFNAAVDALVSGATGPTGPAGESPAGTRTPPGASITDANGDVWTMQSPGSWSSILKNGSGSNGGGGDFLAYCGGVVIASSRGALWQWNNTAWVPFNGSLCPQTN